MPNSHLGIYIHIPFCIKKCSYCDFNSYDNIYEQKDAYVTAITTEISNYSSPGRLADTIYFGGGTPTLLTISDISRIMDSLRQKFNISRDAEITIETNPGLECDFAALASLGFNRLSIGLQSANDDELRVLNRIHTFADFLQTYRTASSHFDNINIDIMYSLPNQTLEKWHHTVDSVIDLKPAHISAYALKLEQGTRLYSQNPSLPTDELDREMYYYVSSLPGYPRYEISNFAPKSAQCRHNLKYWDRTEYVGFGAGAHSLLSETRITNIKNVTEYIKSPQKVEVSEKIEAEEAAREYIILGLRTADGINFSEYKTIFGADLSDQFAQEIAQCTHDGLLTRTQSRIFLTNKGFDLANQVFMRFL